MTYERLSDEQKMQNRIDRRENHDYAAMLDQDAKTAPLIGELVREGKVIYYINVRRRDGTLTGKTVEFSFRFDAVDYLVRNNYV